MRGVPQRGLPVGPVSGAKQVKSAEAPPGHDSFVGVRVNNEIPRHKGSADCCSTWFNYLTRTADQSCGESDFNDGLSKWPAFRQAPFPLFRRPTGTFASGKPSTERFINLHSIIVVPGRSYLVNFHTKLFSESRNNGYFFIAWNSVSEIDAIDYFEISRSPIHCRNFFTERWKLSFQYLPAEPGTYNVSAFFRGTRVYQPAIATLSINVN
jgi:hypothetical protein